MTVKELMQRQSAFSRFHIRRGRQLLTKSGRTSIGEIYMGVETRLDILQILGERVTAYVENTKTIYVREPTRNALARTA